MTVHLPAHPGVVDHRAARDALLTIVLVAVAVILVAAAILIRPAATAPTAADVSQSLVEYRAAERADWGAPILSAERQSLIEFRADERGR